MKIEYESLTDQNWKIQKDGTFMNRKKGKGLNNDFSKKSHRLRIK